MNLLGRVALLTDVEAEACLNFILKGLAAGSPEYEKLLASPTALKDVVAAAAKECGVTLPAEPTEAPASTAQAIRAILVVATEHADLSLRVQGYMDSGRKLRLEPVTTALVLGGIFLILSTEVEIKAEKRKGRQGTWSVKMKKPQLTESLLKQFFTLFS